MQSPLSLCGFSLIKLLVVISIVTFLITLLLPVLSMARDSAKGVVCSSNTVAYELAVE